MPVNLQKMNQKLNNFQNKNIMKRYNKRYKKNFSRYKLYVYLILTLIGYFVYKCDDTATIEQIDRLEIPNIQSDLSEQIIVRDGYALSYNSDRLIPNWVAYELTSLETEGKEARAEHFKTDPKIYGLQATNDDYRNSGWDKGHMAPAADMKWSEQAMDECFYLSNICPQNHELNTGTWKQLEELCRKYAVYFGNLYIVCGPIINKNKYGTIGDNGVMIPDGFYKVLLTTYNSKYIGIGFLFDNKNSSKKLSTYAVTIDEAERVTGIDFFPSLPDEYENSVEAVVDKLIWDL